MSKAWMINLLGIICIASAIEFQRYLRVLGYWQGMVGWLIFWSAIHLFMEWSYK